MVIKIISEIDEAKATEQANAIIADMERQGYYLKSMQYRPVAAVVAEAADGFSIKRKSPSYTACRHNILLAFAK